MLSIVVTLKHGLTLVAAYIHGTEQGCRRLVRDVIAESGTSLALATAPVSAKILAKSRNSSPKKSLGVASSTPTYSASLDIKVKSICKTPKHKKGEPKPTFFICRTIF